MLTTRKTVERHWVKPPSEYAPDRGRLLLSVRVREVLRPPGRGQGRAALPQARPHRHRAHARHARGGRPRRDRARGGRRHRGIELELLEAGAASATSIELSGAYEDEAEALLAERGLDARVERRIGDFVVDASSVEPHDVVVLHRVVCCYPDMDTLVAEAAGHARRTLLLTYPQDRALVRTGMRVVNLALRISRCGFRTYAHRVERILAVAAEHGFVLDTRSRSGLLWETVALARAGA